MAWLAWDWTHDRSLNDAENAVFDRVVNGRPVEPAPSGRVVGAEIDECSIEYLRAQGEGGWPWSRQKHMDLLEAIAAGGGGRFVFASTRMHPDPAMPQRFELTRRNRAEFDETREALRRTSPRSGDGPRA